MEHPCKVCGNVGCVANHRPRMGLVTELVKTDNLDAKVKVSVEEHGIPRAGVEARLTNRVSRFLVLLKQNAPEVLLDTELELIMRAYVLKRRLDRGTMH